MESTYNAGKVMYMVGLTQLAIYGFFKGDFGLPVEQASCFFIAVAQRLPQGAAAVAGDHPGDLSLRVAVIPLVHS